MYIYGRNVVKEAIDSKKPIVKAYLSKKCNDQELINDLKSRHIKIQFAGEDWLNRLVGEHHQGYILEVDEVLTYSLDEALSTEINSNYPLVVILDHIEDPHNFGAIIRTCEAMGVSFIIIPNDRSVGINPTVVKTSAGAIYHTKIVRVPNINAAINKLKKSGYWIIGSDMQGENYATIDYSMPIALVIGNEGHGMSNVVKKNCDFIAKIPMYGQINSLNASVSCGMFLSMITERRMHIDK